MYPAGSGISGASYAVAEFSQSWRTEDPLPALNPGPYGTMTLTARAADRRNPSTSTCEPIVVMLADGVRACGSIRFVENGTGLGHPLNMADIRWTVDGVEYRFHSVGPMDDDVLKVLDSLRVVRR